MNDRTCIVTRRTTSPDELIRFVVGPDSSVVPDLKRNLPGRGCWVTADRTHIEKAAEKRLFSRAFKADVTVPSDLGRMVDGLLAKAALGALGLARKAGSVVLGATKTEAAIRAGTPVAVLHAAEAAEDGCRKIAQARRAIVYLGGPEIPAYKLFSETEMGLALGGTNVIHAALLAGDAGRMALRRLVALDRYRNGFPEKKATLAAVAGSDGAAEDTE